MSRRWFVICLLAFVSGFLVDFCLPRRLAVERVDLRSIYDIAARLEAKHLRLRVFVNGLDGPDRAYAYFTQNPEAPLSLSPVRSPEFAGQWKGVVHVQRIAPYDFPNTRAWGEYGMQVADWLFFGDPDLLRRLEDTLR
jgi:hypothetical protein